MERQNKIGLTEMMKGMIQMVGSMSEHMSKLEELNKALHMEESPQHHGYDERSSA